MAQSCLFRNSDFLKCAAKYLSASKNKPHRFDSLDLISHLIGKDSERQQSASDKRESMRKYTLVHDECSQGLDGVRCYCVTSNKNSAVKPNLKAGAGDGNRTRVTSLGSSGNNHYTTPAYVKRHPMSAASSIAQ